MKGEKTLSELFPKGILRPELYMGTVNAVTTNMLWVDFSGADTPSGYQYMGKRYGKGEVGEFVLVEGQLKILLGRIVEIKLSDEKPGRNSIDALGRVHLLGSISVDTLKITAGISVYPRLGDKVYAAPYNFISQIPCLIGNEKKTNIMLRLGTVGEGMPCDINVRVEKLFGRHLAILGSTGGGKSWTMARIIGECMKFKSKMILIDATGEYHTMMSKDCCRSVYLCDSLNVKGDQTENIKCSLPPSMFQESDFIALFEPAGKVQGPKLKEAIRSLRLATLCPTKFPSKYIMKKNQSKSIYKEAINENDNLTKIDDPRQEFDVTLLPKQIEEECVWPNGNNDSEKWGKEDNSFGYCLSLISRINLILTSPAFSCIFKDKENPLNEEIENFITKDDLCLFRIDLSSVPFEYKAREIISNVIGRFLLAKARKGEFIKCPLLIFLDEAHNFLGKNIGGEDSYAKLDAFELIAKEGRKFGLNICLSSQRPRDITEGVLSQIGTLIVHRLTNDRDRDIVERACGEIDKMASSFLPSLEQGEVAIIGSDFPIPLTVNVMRPEIAPDSSGPDYQNCWR
ncbi:ATP-binding protein [Aminobacterium sp. MB27-C1]|uniref:ATP-binding protein n=1 Tax=Aminobacterium sp. MB27-C1 TaxID=3070661 RepID=UPI0027DDB9FC|nr:ATP-binding protein [Aminobacterium sp. MB27-C1]WMI72307.1 ATP-binding protein [Aminobacterium sp. MB27-C1]